MAEKYDDVFKCIEIFEWVFFSNQYFQMIKNTLYLQYFIIYCLY